MAQILNISLRLKYMETLQRASFKNSYLYQIQITLADKENPQRLQHFYQKNRRSYVSLPIQHIRPLLTRGHQMVTIMNLNIYCF